MTRGRAVAVAAAAGLGSAGSVAATAMGSPLPVLVAGGLLLVVLVPLAIAVLVAALSRDPARSERAMEVLRLFLVAIPSYPRPNPIPAIPSRHGQPRVRALQGQKPGPDASQSRRSSR